jgi:hypothetical protein
VRALTAYPHSQSRPVGEDSVEVGASHTWLQEYKDFICQPQTIVVVAHLSTPTLF